MGFIQIIEYRTRRVDELRSLVESFLAETEGVCTASAGTLAQDRERPDTYVNIVEFDSYESAMENSRLPQTAAMAEKMQGLCDGPMVFRNLDVVQHFGA